MKLNIERPRVSGRLIGVLQTVLVGSLELNIQLPRVSGELIEVAY